MATHNTDVRTPAAPAGTATTTRAKKHVTPKWVDSILIAILIAIPVLYALGFSVNYGPSMAHLGWFYRTSWGEQPTHVGQIVRFAPPDQPTWRKYILPSVKRVVDIRKDGYFVEGDNPEHSQDSRDWGKVVPPDHVAGVVNWCWSPKRAWRGRTEEGRFINELEFANLPRMFVLANSHSKAVVRRSDGFILARAGKADVKLHLERPYRQAVGAVAWSPDERYVAVLYHGGIAIFDSVGRNSANIPFTAKNADQIVWAELDRIEVVLAGQSVRYDITPTTGAVVETNILLEGARRVGLVK